jgi:hypothetical protein
LFISHTIACLDRIGVAAQPLHCHTGVAAQPQPVTTSLFGPKLALRRVQSIRAIAKRGSSACSSVIPRPHRLISGQMTSYAVTQRRCRPM